MAVFQQYKESIGQRTKIIIIDELRNYFQNVSTFGFPGSNVKMPIIRETYGRDLRAYPAVFIKIVSVNRIPLGINQDYVQDVMSDDQLVGQQYLPGTENFTNPVPYRRRVIAERTGFMANVTLSLQVWADTTPVRNRLVDECIAAFQKFQRQRLMDRGLIFETINEGEEADYPLNDTEHIFIANISLTVNAELYFDTPVSSITKISGVIVAGTDDPYPDTPPYILQ
jgi:hypothetical protein